MHEPLIGRTCVVEYKDKLWPVVVCGRQHLQEAFLLARPQGEDHLPCIFLGIHKYIWVKYTRIHEYDPTASYLREDTPFEEISSRSTDVDVVKLKEQHRQAVQIEAPQLNGADFWWNYINQESDIRKVQMAVNAKGDSQSRRSRKPQDDASDEVQFVGTRQKPHVEPTKASSSHAGGHHGEKSSQRTISNGKNSMKVTKSRKGGQRLSSSQRAAIIKSSSQAGQSPSTQLRTSNPPIAGKDDCYVLVGEEQTSFLVPKTAVARVNMLALQANQTLERGAYINLSETISMLTQEAFYPVQIWLRHGEFHPRLTVRDHTDKVEWEIIRARPNQIETIALAYFGASLLEINELQDLCYRKLQAIYPIAPQALMKVAACIADSKKWGWERENEVDQWLESHMQDHFWILMEEDGKALSKYLRHHGEMRKALLLKMAEDPEAGDRGRDGSR